MTETARTRGFVLVALAFLVAMMGTTLPTPLYPIYQDRLGFSGLTITVIFATYAAGVIVALVLFGNLSDRIGRKRTLIPGLVAAALSAACFLFADGLAPLLVGRFLSGLCAGIFTGTATATLVDLAPRGDRARAALVATVVNMGGLGLGPVLAGVLSEVAPQPLHLVFGVHLVLLALVGIGLRAVTEPTAAQGRFKLVPRGFDVPAEIRGVFARASLAAFAGFAVTGMFMAVAPALLGQVIGVTDHAAVGVIAAGIFAGSIAGQVLRRDLRDTVALAGGCATLIVGMVLLVGAVQAASLALLIAAGLVAGVGQGMSFAAGLALIAASAPEDRRGATTSSFFIVGYVAISLPVVGVGVLAQVTDLVAAGTIFAALVILLAGGVALSLARTGRARAAA